MKNFLKYSFIILLFVIALLYTLDFAFTYMYKNNTPRNKISFAYNGIPKKYDVLFLGSSRANNHFVPKIFIDKGYKSFNFGMSGSRLEETALLLQLLLEKGNKVKTVVLEVDLNINSNGSSEGTRASFYPYIKDSETISNYYKQIPDFKLLYCVPFYRYLKYDSQIGFRELFFTVVGKKSSGLQSYGFYALKNTGINMEYNLSDYSPKKNQGYELIKQICVENKIELIAVTTPMCKNINNTNYFDAVVKLYPEIHNLENVITDENQFSSCGHMNEKGATQFTNYILENFFK